MLFHYKLISVIPSISSYTHTKTEAEIPTRSESSAGNKKIPEVNRPINQKTSIFKSGNIYNKQI